MKANHQRIVDDFLKALKKSRRENAKHPPHVYQGPLPNIRQRAEYTEAPVERDMQEGREAMNY